MRKSRFTDEQQIAILAEAEHGGRIDEVIRCHGVSRETFFAGAIITAAYK